MIRFQSIVLAALAALVAVAAITTQLDNYLLYVVILWALFATLAVSFDVLLGYTGYLSLAHGALFGFGE